MPFFSSSYTEASACRLAALVSVKACRASIGYGRLADDVVVVGLSAVRVRIDDGLDGPGILGRRVATPGDSVRLHTPLRSRRRLRAQADAHLTQVLL